MYYHLVTTKAHHEMGHIQYYLQTKNLSYFYRDGANPGGEGYIKTSCIRDEKI